MGDGMFSKHKIDSNCHWLASHALLKEGTIGGYFKRIAATCKSSGSPLVVSDMRILRVSLSLKADGCKLLLQT